MHPRFGRYSAREMVYVGEFGLITCIRDAEPRESATRVGYNGSGPMLLVGTSADCPLFLARGSSMPRVQKKSNCNDKNDVGSRNQLIVSHTPLNWWMINLCVASNVVHVKMHELPRCRGDVHVDSQWWSQFGCRSSSDSTRYTDVIVKGGIVEKYLARLSACSMKRKDIRYMKDQKKNTAWVLLMEE